MKTIKKNLIVILLGLSLLSTSAFATTILQVPQGGTGVGSITGIITGNGTAPFSTFSHNATLTGNGTIVAPLSVVGGTSSNVTNVKVGTTVALPNINGTSYFNGIGNDGVGATLTENINGALGAIDGVTLILNDRILVKNQSVALQYENGVYSLTTVGTSGAKFVLTRTTDADTITQINDELVAIATGTTQAGSSWGQTQVITAIDGVQKIIYTMSTGLFVTQSPGCTNVIGEIPFYTPNQRQLNCSPNITFIQPDTLNLGDSTDGRGKITLGGNPFANQDYTNQNLSLGSVFSSIVAGVTNSIAIGKQAGQSLASGASDNIFIGAQTGITDTTGSHNTLVGFHSASLLLTGGYNTVYGDETFNNLQAGFGNTVIGAQAQPSGDPSNITVIGMQAEASGDGAIALGTNSVAPAHTFVAGDENTPITDLILGGGTTGTTTHTVTYHGGDIVAGTSNTAGGTTTLQGGISTGTGHGGDVVVSVSQDGSTGTTQNAPVEGLRVIHSAAGVNPTVKISNAYTLPSTDGSANQVMHTNGSGALSWGTPTTGTVTSVSGTTNQIDSTGGATPVISIDAGYVGQSSITTLGTIGTGTWAGTAISAIHGGTAQTTYTTGDTLYASGTNTLSKRAIGSTGNVLTVSGGVPTWAAPATNGTVTSITATSPLTGGTITTTGSIGCQVASGSQAGCLAQADFTNFSNGIAPTVGLPLTSLQISNLNTTPITLVAAPGVGKTIVPISVVENFTGNGVGYATNVNQIVYEDGISATTWLAEDTTILLNTGNSIKLMPFNSSTTTPGNLAVNSPLLLSVLTGNPALGNGTEIITVTYKVETI